ncbi:hypothetical protein AVEN_227790-1 [Araneus ventricosus]|uniref:Uncharacterized protein n=1 Tax=Araneus ventricosus TaxID=182803 RepID=A0A4Y2GP70_ARAVE|nr:hypothetical protein AVEN_227790-1 [Araneus ventricosus]
MLHLPLVAKYVDVPYGLGSDSGPEGRGSRPDSISICWVWWMINLAGSNDLPLVCRSFERRMVAQESSSSSDHGLKLRDLPNVVSYNSKRDIYQNYLFLHHVLVLSMFFSRTAHAALSNPVPSS